MKSFIAPSIISTVILSLLMSTGTFGSDACKIDDQQASAVSVIGTARSLDSGIPLYCEYHFGKPEKNRVVVEYRDLNNTLIARKKLDYSANSLKPSVIQEDFRHRELRQVEPGNSPQTLDVAYREANTDVIQQTKIASSKATVVDAGFDQAVRRYWDRLMRDEEISVDFVSPAHLRSFDLTIRKSDREPCKQQNYREEQQVCLLIGPGNRLIGLFVKPLVLIYDKSSKRLDSFSGSVNITSADGKTLRATVSYLYTDGQADLAALSED